MAATADSRGPPSPTFITRGDVAASAAPPAVADEADEVESPSIANTSAAIARFEFEAGKGSHEGTKILMVEWEDDESTRDVKGDWHISWEGKKTVLPAGDRDASSDHSIRRLYFMLPPATTVPSVITLTLQPSTADDAAATTKSTQPIVWRTNPLPAIFPPELGASARAAGKKGVLHTLWAKKRLQVLQAEIDAECRSNAEGVGLMMAVQEKEWIEQNFGVVSRTYAPAESSSSPTLGLLNPSAAGRSDIPTLPPASPRSPGGTRLMDKLKGLKLNAATGEPSTSAAGPAQSLLSPESSDVAISSFSAIKGLSPTATSSEATSSSSSQQQQQQQHLPPRTGSSDKPSSLSSRQHQQILQSEVSSMDAIAGTGSSPSTTGTEKGDEKEEASGLFALPMSPRSPEMTKSPFSFAGAHPRKYVQSGA